VIGPVNERPEEGSIVLSDSSEGVVTKTRGRKPRTRPRVGELNLSADLANLIFTPCPDRLLGEDLIAKDVDDIAGITQGWLKDMETVRTKSNNMNGRLSGILKDRIACVKTVIKTLIDKVKDTGDVSFLLKKQSEDRNPRSRP